VVGFLSLSFCAGAAAQDPTISLKAVTVGTRVINPTGEVNALRDDVIMVEIKISDWSPGGEALIAYQVAIDVSGFESGETGSVRPIGSEHVCPPQPCVDDEDCGVDMACLANGCCYGPEFFPGQGAFILENRNDYVFFGKSTFGVVDVFNYKYGQTLALDSDCETYAAPVKYGGTLMLQVTADASGTFTIPILPFSDSKLLGCDDDFTWITPLATEPLIVHVPALNRMLVESEPPNCSVGPRQPSDPSGAIVMTRNSMALRFDPPATDDLTMMDFSVREDPVGTEPIDIASLTLSDPEFGWATVTFSRPVTEGAWTCVTYLSEPPVEVCAAPLPGDVDSNRLVDSADVQKLVDHLNGVLDPPLNLASCDIDRSGRCGPADLLREMDLLGAAEAYSPWLGQTLPPCPSAP
jgi:hypothetical protein